MLWVTRSSLELFLQMYHHALFTTQMTVQNLVSQQNSRDFGGVSAISVAYVTIGEKCDIPKNESEVR